ncbi:MAG: flavodoxin [Lachnospiraceae bacterium]|nr:flavodoxin [Lachnospiraceae bacterium]
MMRYKVVFASRTGNTELLAKKIYHAIDDPSKDIERISASTSSLEAEVYLVGFWVDRGTCSPEVMDFLDSIHNKDVILFGTCGTGQDEIYYNRLTRMISGLVPDDNRYLGTYLCQGKMPMAVRKRYEEWLKDERMASRAEYMIRNFDEALLHPNERDLDCAVGFLYRMLEKRSLSDRGELNTKE